MPERPAILRILSGGQTGVDQAALDVARLLGIPTGGYVPAGRWTARGPLPTDYAGLEEVGMGVDGLPADLALRTWMNVETADLTLIIDYEGVPSDPGTQATRAFVAQKDARRLGVDARGSADLSTLIEARVGGIDPEAVLPGLRRALDGHLARLMQARKQRGANPVPVVTLNIAGPRQAAPDSPEAHRDIHAEARVLLLALLEPERRPFRVASGDRDKVIEQAFESLRHWDTVRWLAPFFFFTLAGGAVLGLQGLPDDAAFRLISIALALAGYLSLLLIWKTVSYHRQQTRVLVALGIDPKGLPMLGFNWWRTATLQFSGVILLATGLFTLAAILGRDGTLQALGAGPEAAAAAIEPQRSSAAADD
jgi:hypothetical protein